MLRALQKNPAWFTFLLTGIPFGAAMGAYSKFDGRSTAFAVISGAFIGLLFGWATTYALRRQDFLVVETLKSSSPEVRRAAQHALRRGPVPADPEVRAAAIALAGQQLTVLHRWQIPSLIIWSLLLVMNVLRVIDEFSLLRAVLIPIYLLLVIYQLYRPWFLRKRIELLRR